MRILLIRHAEPDYAIDSLTPKGKVEAELLSRRLVHYQIRDFYVSPLGRAKATAEYTLRKMNRSAEELPWLAADCLDHLRLLPDCLLPHCILAHNLPPAR